MQSVVIPPQTHRTYLRSTYDDPKFIVGNMWRRYAGHWDQDPAHLLPGDNVALSHALCDAAGGPLALATKAYELLDTDLSTATQLIEYAGQAAPDDVEVHTLRADIYRRRKEAEKSLMAQSIFGDAEKDSLKIIGKL